MTLPTSELATALPPCDVTVVGGTGDLALRKLLPALYQSERRGSLAPGSRVIGASRSALDDHGYRTLVGEALERHVPADELDAPVVARLLDRLHHVEVDAGSAEGWHLLHELLKEAPTGGPAAERVRVFSLAVTPRLSGPICQQLDAIGVVEPTSRVVLEKPLGSDLASARLVNDAVGRVFA